MFGRKLNKERFLNSLHADESCFIPVDKLATDERYTKFINVPEVTVKIILPLHIDPFFYPADARVCNACFFDVNRGNARRLWPAAHYLPVVQSPTSFLSRSDRFPQVHIPPVRLMYCLVGGL